MIDEFGDHQDLPHIPKSVHHLTDKREVEYGAKTIMARHLFHDHKDSEAEIRRKLKLSSPELKRMLDES